MNTHVSPRRGKELLSADRAYRTGGGMARLIALAPASLFHQMLDRIDAGLAHGTIESHLPDGSVRLLGGRGKGPTAVVRGELPCGESSKRFSGLTRCEFLWALESVPRDP